MLARLLSVLYQSIFNLLIRYRRTMLGPLWLMIGPSLFIGLLGLLYGEIAGIEPEIFIPHLATGLIIWTLIHGFIVGSPTVFYRNRSQILQGTQSLNNIVAVDVITTTLFFIHQVPIILIVFFIYEIDLNWVALESFIGFILLVVNGAWVSYVFGIFGARYHDLSEVFNAVMRIAFLATPIMWMSSDRIQGGLMTTYLIFNPFYHFIEIVRQPLLGQSPALLSWVIVIGVTLAGLLLAQIMKKHYAWTVPFWV